MQIGARVATYRERLVDEVPKLIFVNAKIPDFFKKSGIGTA
jgi:hypothetical protein